MINVTKIEQLEDMLYAAKGKRGNPIPQAIKNYMVKLQKSNPEIKVSWGGERTMDFFRAKYEDLVFLDENSHQFEFAENPPARSRNFFAFEQKENEITLFARFC